MKFLTISFPQFLCSSAATRRWLNNGKCLLLPTLCMLLSACVSGPVPEKASWPWEYGKEFGNNQTGDYITIRGNVANFDKAPKTEKPVNPESLNPSAASAPEPATTKPAPSLPPTAAKPGSTEPKNGYDFAVHDVTMTPALSMNAVRTYEIIACNHGNAPVSVTIGIDSTTSHNIATDKTLPFSAVVPPNTDQVLARVWPRNDRERFNFRYPYSWNIGDYRAAHTCPEHYRFPFGRDVQAFAQVNNDANASAFNRHSVIFAMPPATPVLAARKGIVVRTEADKIDILHDDATIATYDHLGRISKGISAGKAVAAGDTLGTVGTANGRREGYLQLNVWRPEQSRVTSIKTVDRRVSLDSVSFPLEFCFKDASDCRVITQSQRIPGQKGSKQAARRTAKQ